MKEVHRALRGGDCLVAEVHLGLLDGDVPEEVGLVLAVGKFDCETQRLLERLESRDVIAEGDPDLATLVENGLLGVTITCVTGMRQG